MIILFLRVLTICLVILGSITNTYASSGHGHAEEPKPEETGPVSTVEYVRLKPAFVANYGGPGRLRYLKVDISLRVMDSNAETAIMMHMAPIRNIMVSILSDQTEESVMTSLGKDALRKQALLEINEFFKAELGIENMVNDLLFNTFIVQQ